MLHITEHITYVTSSAFKDAQFVVDPFYFANRQI
jgi:hypothetical protein